MAPTANAHVYSRPEGFYITALSRTTAGLWIYSGDPSFLAAAADDLTLGGMVAEALGESGSDARHPRQDEWTEERKRALGPLMALAHVRSWKTFLAPAVLVSIAHEGDAVTVTPHARDSRRYDVFTEMVEERITVARGDAEALGRAARKAEGIAR